MTAPTVAGTGAELAPTTRLEAQATLEAHADALGIVLGDLDVVSDAELLDLFVEYGADELPPVAPGEISLERARPPGMLEGLIHALPDVVNKYTAAAALVTAVWYRQLAPELDYDPEPFYDLPPDQVENSARWALFAPGDGNPLSRFLGAKQRMVYDASRDTVRENAIREPGARWIRQAREDACAFCRVLATRGALDYGLYKIGEADLGRFGPPGGLRGNTGLRVGYSESGIRGPRKLDELYHDRCRCEVIAVRPGQSYAQPDYMSVWVNEYYDARRGIEENDEIASDLKIGGEVPNIRNVTQYMRHAQAREEGGPAGEPFRRGGPSALVKKMRAEPAWMSMPRTSRDEIAAQFSARTGIPVRPDRKTSVKNAFGIRDDPEMLRQYCDGYADMVDKYGINDMAVRNQVSLRMGTSGRFSKDYAYAWVQPYQLRSGAGDVDMYFNRGWTKDPEGYAASVKIGETPQEWSGGGRKRPKLKRSDGTYQTSPFKSTHGSWSPTRGTAVHETAHVMDAVLNWRPTKAAQQALLDRYLELNPGLVRPVETDFTNYMKFSKAFGEYIDKRDGGFRDWLYESLPGYAFHENGMLHPQEAIAESFKTVEAIGPDKSTEPQRVLHDLLTREYVAAQQAGTSPAA